MPFQFTDELTFEVSDKLKSGERLVVRVHIRESTDAFIKRKTGSSVREWMCDVIANHFHDSAVQSEFLIRKGCKNGKSK